jgi:hypothetical protein
MAAEIVNAGVAAAVAVEARDRVHRARLKPFSKYIARRAAPSLTAASVVPEHCLILVTSGLVAGLFACPAAHHGFLPGSLDAPAPRHADIPGSARRRQGKSTKAGSGAFRVLAAGLDITGPDIAVNRNYQKHVADHSGGEKLHVRGDRYPAPGQGGQEDH